MYDRNTGAEITRRHRTDAIRRERVVMIRNDARDNGLLKLID